MGSESIISLQILCTQFKALVEDFNAQIHHIVWKLILTYSYLFHHVPYNFYGGSDQVILQARRDVILCVCECVLIQQVTYSSSRMNIAVTIFQNSCIDHANDVWMLTPNHPKCYSNNADPCLYSLQWEVPIDYTKIFLKHRRPTSDLNLTLTHSESNASCGLRCTRRCASLE